MIICLEKRETIESAKAFITKLVEDDILFERLKDELFYLTVLDSDDLYDLIDLYVR